MRGRATWVALLVFGATLGAQAPTPDTSTKPDNYYAAGNRVEVTQPMAGDVVVAARDVQIGATVGGDILAAGWHVSLTAPADDDVRMAGGEVTLNAPVGGDVTLAGGNVSLGPATHVAGRTWLSGRTVAVNGVFERDLRIAAQNVTIAGAIRQPLSIVAETVEFLPTARVNAPVTYRSPSTATIRPGAVIGGPIKYEHIERREVDEARALPIGSSLLFGLHLLIVGLLVIAVAPGVTPAVIATLRSRPWWSLLAGFALLVTVPVAALLLVISILGLPLGLALGAAYFVALFLGVLATAFFVGDTEARLLHSGPLVTRRDHIVWFVAGVATLAVLRLLPGIGALVVFFSILFGLGALTLQAWSSLQHAQVR